VDQYVEVELESMSLSQTIIADTHIVGSHSETFRIARHFKSHEPGGIRTCTRIDASRGLVLGTSFKVTNQTMSNSFGHIKDPMPYSKMCCNPVVQGQYITAVENISQLSCRCSLDFGSYEDIRMITSGVWHMQRYIHYGVG